MTDRDSAEPHDDDEEGDLGGTISGEVKPTLSGLSLAPARPPHTYMGVAEALLPGVKLLAEATPPPAIALSLLAAHTLECLLKALLSRDGFDAELMSLNLRHNLRRLWERSVSEGAPISREVPVWVERLGRLHDKPYHLRYSKGVHGIGTPLAQEMTSGLVDLLETVRRNL